MCVKFKCQILKLSVQSNNRGTQRKQDESLQSSESEDGGSLAGSLYKDKFE